MGGHTVAVAASFPCAQARTATEKAICASPELSELDDHLGRYHAAARLRLGSGQACLQQDQKAWLQGQRGACKDNTACLRDAYLQRLATLHPLQAGMSALRQMPLPVVPALVWMVPPAADQVAAPRNTPTARLGVSGRIVNDIADGDGLVLMTESGVKHVVIPSMLLDEPSSSELIGLSRMAGARYTLVGRADVQGRSPKAFAAGHCIAVYREAP
jgi:uncharacterized protein YecT (DUF1311 family)